MKLDSTINQHIAQVELGVVIGASLRWAASELNTPPIHKVTHPCTRMKTVVFISP